MKNVFEKYGYFLQRCASIEMPKIQKLFLHPPPSKCCLFHFLQFFFCLCMVQTGRQLHQRTMFRAWCHKFVILSIFFWKLAFSFRIQFWIHRWHLKSNKPISNKLWAYPDMFCMLIWSVDIVRHLGWLK